MRPSMNALSAAVSSELKAMRCAFRTDAVSALDGSGFFREDGVGAADVFSGAVDCADACAAASLALSVGAVIGSYAGAGFASFRGLTSATGSFACVGAGGVFSAGAAGVFFFSGALFSSTSARPFTLTLSPTGSFAGGVSAIVTGAGSGGGATISCFVIFGSSATVSTASLAGASPASGLASGTGAGTGDSAFVSSGAGLRSGATVVSSTAKTATLLPSESAKPPTPASSPPHGSAHADAANADVGSRNAGAGLDRLFRRSSEVPSLSTAMSPRPPFRHLAHGSDCDDAWSPSPPPTTPGGLSGRWVPSGAIADAVPSAAKINTVLPDKDHASADGWASSSLHGVTDTRLRSAPENTNTAAAVAREDVVVAEASESFGSRRFASPPGFAPPSTATARYEPSGLHAVAETLHFLAITRDWATVASRSIEVSESAWDARSAAPEDAVAGCQFNPDSSAPDSPPFFSSLSATSHPPSSANAKRRVVFAIRASESAGSAAATMDRFPSGAPSDANPSVKG